MDEQLINFELTKQQALLVGSILYLFGNDAKQRAQQWINAAQADPNALENSLQCQKDSREMDLLLHKLQQLINEAEEPKSSIILN